MPRTGAGDKGERGGSRLESWLTEKLGLVAPLQMDQIPGGWSNVTSVVTDNNGRRVVIRQPPATDFGGGAHDVLREARIMSALRETAVPVPRVLGTCAEPDVAQHPFFVMEFAPGEVVGSPAAARRIDVGQRRGLGFALIDMLADLQAVDLDAVGLGDFRHRTPYVQRQLRRWTAQWHATTDRSVPAVDHVADRLQRWANGLDPPSSDVLVHQDFRLGNVMVVADPEPRISALLDWELTTSGHRLADLGFLGARMQAPSEVLESGEDPSAVEGYPSFDELVARFQHRTGVPADDLPNFIAMSAWRWAIIVEGIQQRITTGAMGEIQQSAPWHQRRVEVLAEFAAGLVG